ncbi:UDP-N-acetylmuramoyl-L-alanine--D-glutamate ligase [Tamaricihabitans halophyticus]|uniref:UDP-N-acetylmuramoyl-L-alanine--D-glutamate ligase n=1 Tax=Tamaricihabitans halophyticus TaxID=1262583 RepID=UPI0014055C99|nr:UDP-N-acetylmuramoyl-L-alanine--D-glutamate ligase [Tamaricihabitans halophyticus]
MGLAGRRVLVAGAGVSGRSAAAALHQLGAVVTVTDASAERLDELAELAAGGVELCPGLTAPPSDTDLVVTSPGWRPDSPVLVAAARAGIEVIGEVELALRLAAASPTPPSWLAVTGTNGKTTTVGMLAAILRAAGVDAAACGNIGLPVIDAVLGGHAVLAVELSSFQLHWQRSLRAHAAVVLNVAEDHLDWHGTLEAYAADKGAIYAGARYRLINLDEPYSVRLAELADGEPVGYTVGVPAAGQLGVQDDQLLDRAFRDGADTEGAGTVLAEVADVRPVGPHNLSNALAAAALARAYGVQPSAVRDGLRAYQPEAHRAVLIAERDGVRYIDDSKATNPHAAASSLSAHDGVVWIAGGQLKGASVDALVAEVASRLHGVVVLGVDRGTIAAAVARHAPDVPVHTVDPGDDEAMTAAVGAARAMTRPGDVVLLAPAGASFDMFRSYGDRGAKFVAAVHAQLGISEHGDEHAPDEPVRGGRAGS